MKKSLHQSTFKRKSLKMIDSCHRIELVIFFLALPRVGELLNFLIPAIMLRYLNFGDIKGLIFHFVP